MFMICSKHENTSESSRESLVEKLNTSVFGVTYDGKIELTASKNRQPALIQVSFVLDGFGDGYAFTKCLFRFCDPV